MIVMRPPSTWKLPAVAQTVLFDWCAPSSEMFVEAALEHQQSRYCPPARLSFSEPQEKIIVEKVS